MVNCKSDEDNDDIEQAVQMISKMTKMTMIADNQEFVDDTKKDEEYDDRKLKISFENDDINNGEEEDLSGLMRLIEEFD